MECEKCHSLYDEKDHEPRLLMCGHEMCWQCIDGCKAQWPAVPICQRRCEELIEGLDDLERSTAVNWTANAQCREIAARLFAEDDRKRVMDMCDEAIKYGRERKYQSKIACSERIWMLRTVSLLSEEKQNRESSSTGPPEHSSKRLREAKNFMMRTGNVRQFASHLASCHAAVDDISELKSLIEAYCEDATRRWDPRNPSASAEMTDLGDLLCRLFFCVLCIDAWDCGDVENLDILKEQRKACVKLVRDKQGECGEPDIRDPCARALWAHAISTRASAGVHAGQFLRYLQKELDYKFTEMEERWVAHAICGKQDVEGRWETCYTWEGRTAEGEYCFRAEDTHFRGSQETDKFVKVDVDWHRYSVTAASLNAFASAIGSLYLLPKVLNVLVARKEFLRNPYNLKGSVHSAEYFTRSSILLQHTHIGTYLLWFCVEKDDIGFELQFSTSPEKSSTLRINVFDPLQFGDDRGVVERSGELDPLLSFQPLAGLTKREGNITVHCSTVEELIADRSRHFNDIQKPLVYPMWDGKPLSPALFEEAFQSYTYDPVGRMGLRNNCDVLDMRARWFERKRGSLVTELRNATSGSIRSETLQCDPGIFVVRIKSVTPANDASLQYFDGNIRKFEEDSHPFLVVEYTTGHVLKYDEPGYVEMFAETKKHVIDASEDGAVFVDTPAHLDVLQAYMKGLSPGSDKGGQDLPPKERHRRRHEMRPTLPELLFCTLVKDSEDAEKRGWLTLSLDEYRRGAGLPQSPPGKKHSKAAKWYLLDEEDVEFILDDSGGRSKHEDVSFFANASGHGKVIRDHRESDVCWVKLGDTREKNSEACERRSVIHRNAVLELNSKIRELRGTDAFKHCLFMHGIFATGSNADFCLVTDSRPVKRLPTYLAEKSWHHGHPLPLMETIEKLEDIGKGLRSLHSVGLCHGNLRPEDILVANDESGNTKCILGGLEACAIAGKEPAIRRDRWISPYWPIEQYRDAIPDFADDVLSFGTIGFYLFTGMDPKPAPPFDKHHNVLSEAQRRERDVENMLDSSAGWETLKQLIIECMTKPRDTRPSLEHAMKTLSVIRSKYKLPDLSGAVEVEEVMKTSGQLLKGNLVCRGKWRQSDGNVSEVTAVFCGEQQLEHYDFSSLQGLGNDGVLRLYGTANLERPGVIGSAASPGIQRALIFERIQEMSLLDRIRAEPVCGNELHDLYTKLQYEVFLSQAIRIGMGLLAIQNSPSFKDGFGALCCGNICLDASGTPKIFPWVSGKHGLDRAKDSGILSCIPEGKVNIVNRTSDVFCFGKVLLAMLSAQRGELVRGGAFADLELNEVDVAKFCGGKEYDELRRIILRCVSHSKRERPQLEEAVEQLKKLGGHLYTSVERHPDAGRFRIHIDGSEENQRDCIIRSCAKEKQSHQMGQKEIHGLVFRSLHMVESWMRVQSWANTENGSWCVAMANEGKGTFYCADPSLLVELKEWIRISCKWDKVKIAVDREAYKQFLVEGMKFTTKVMSIDCTPHALKDGVRHPKAARYVEEMEASLRDISFTNCSLYHVPHGRMANWQFSMGNEARGKIAVNKTVCVVPMGTEYDCYTASFLELQNLREKPQLTTVCGFLPTRRAALVEWDDAALEMWPLSERLSTITLNQCLNVALSVAQGMKILHDRDFTYCRLSPSSVMVDAKFSTVKLRTELLFISDLGVSLEIKRNSVQKILGRRYNAALSLEQLTSKVADVITFGVFCEQLFGRFKDVPDALPMVWNNCLNCPQRNILFGEIVELVTRVVENPTSSAGDVMIPSNAEVVKITKPKRQMEEKKEEGEL